MIHVLDTRQLDRPGIIAVTAVETGDGIALFDTGAESTFDHVVDELEKIGASTPDLRHVFLSHIHLDHAGAAWRFAEHGAQIYVHPRGAAHLIDPTKLINSATKIFGGEMKTLWGEIRPIPAGSVRVLEDNETVRLGQLEIRALSTPGHANHHHAYTWEDNLFGGDIAGVRIRNGPPVPPFVPPELDVTAWVESIDRLRRLELRQLYLPHFGKATGALSDHFDQLEKRVEGWANWFRDRLRADASEIDLRPEFAAKLADEVEQHGASKENARDYELADPSFMAVTAAIRYWRKKFPEEFEKNSPNMETSAHPDSK